MVSLVPWAVELVGPKGYIHGWIKVGAEVEHKDSSKGVVRRYDPATQTAHVDWSSGPRSRVKGGSGTTKAYHLIKPGETKVAEPPKREYTPEEIQKAPRAELYNAKTVGAKVEQLKKEAGQIGFGRKHDWVKPGIGVKHKDGSVGVVKSYDPNTQTMHVDWQRGKRAGTTGTTKAYHTSKVMSDGSRIKPDQNAAVNQIKAKLKTEGSIRVDPKKAQDERLRAKDEADLRSIGLKPITVGRDSSELRYQLAKHYQARDKAVATGHHASMGSPEAQAAFRTTDLIDAHHLDQGLPLLSDRAHIAARETDPSGMGRAQMVQHLANLHADSGKKPLGGYDVIKGLGAEPGQTTNEYARGTWNGVYRTAERRIEFNSQILSPTDTRPSSTLNQRGFFVKTPGASQMRRTSTHEFGHFLHHQMPGGVHGGSAAAMFAEMSKKIGGAQPYQVGRNIEDWATENKAAIINHVSVYASANSRELIGELYTEGKLSPNPSPAAQVVVKHLEGRA